MHRARLAPPRVFLPFALFCLFIAAPFASAQAPSPESVIGFEPGADGRLADWNAILDYFHRLDAASDRISVEDLGSSTEGKPMILAVLGSEKNLKAAEEIKANLSRLADPRSLGAEEAQALIRDTPVAVFVGCAQHATEIASTQASMKIAFDLVSGESPEMQRIRENTLLLLVPSLNPDGHQMVCDWYKEQAGTPFEGCRLPWLYQKYVGHDINRDWAMLTQKETQNVSRVLYKEWLPQIVVDVHQMGSRGARMFIPPYYDPINPNLDPLLEHELGLLCAQMRLDMSAAGHTGIITNAMFDEWLMGYLTSIPTRHNMVAQLIEMASVNVASPVFLRRSDLHGERGEEYGLRANFPEPWPGGWWRLGDITAYERTAIQSVLGLAARSRASFLENFYTLGCKQIEKGKEEPPFAFLVPPQQDDPAAAWKMLDVLMAGGMEVDRATAPFEADGVTYRPGTEIVLMAQPFRAHAKDLLEIQTYPNLRAYPGGPPDRPYDIAGWTLPLLMGVETVEVVDPFKAELERMERTQDPPEGSIQGETGGASPWLLVDRRQNNAFRLVNRCLAAGLKVQVLSKEHAQGGRTFPAGTFAVPGKEAAGWVHELGLRAAACADFGGEEAAPMQPVRIGLYKSWTASMDEGWTRWLLEQFEFPLKSVHDAEIRAGRLIDRYDVIVLPAISERAILEGNSEGSVPARYTGGLGEEGVFSLRDFVHAGGTLIAMDSSCDFVIDKLELPVKNVARREDREHDPAAPASEAPRDEKKTGCFCPGSILRVQMDPSQPLAFGFGQAAAIFHMNSPVFEIVEKQGPERTEGAGRGKQDEEENKAEKHAEPQKPAVETSARIVGFYPNINPLMSGWIEGDEAIRGKGALVQAGFGKGKVVLIGFRCQYRAQAYGTFKVLFNAILNAGTEF